MRSVRSLVVVHAMGVWVAAASPPTDPAPRKVELLTRQDADGGIAGWKSFHAEATTKTGAVWTLGPDGVLICKGIPLGYLYTERDYTNFVLKLQWRWPPSGKAGNGGVLIRTTGPNKIWPKSLEAQLNAGQAGDFWGLDGYPLQGPAERLKSLENPKFGKLTNLKKTADLEKPVGQWNDYEIVAEGDTVTLKVNGRVVNRATGCEVVPGKILLTAEGDEIHFRRLELWPK
jgi:hypothetical protein